MPLFSRLKQSFFPHGKKETEPAEAYDQWSSAYDSQPDNLMLAMDEQVTTSLLEGMLLQSKIIADIGCGTGRHWEKLKKGDPKRILGFDVSSGMLTKLREKYPEAETYLLKDQHLPGLEDNSCDLVISTLTIAHIRNFKEALKEWSRVLKPGGHLLITDYHPVALDRGARRTFRYQHHTVAIRNYIHPIEKISKTAGQLGLLRLRFIERKIDETVKPFYEKQQALAVYEKFYGTPIIYGILLMKANAAESGKYNRGAGFNGYQDPER
ncbi:MAG: methyltransferase domain-containing protein [Chitinophagales bacterium]